MLNDSSSQMKDLYIVLGIFAGIYVLKMLMKDKGTLLLRDKNTGDIIGILPFDEKFLQVYSSFSEVNKLSNGVV